MVHSKALHDNMVSVSNKHEPRTIYDRVATFIKADYAFKVASANMLKHWNSLTPHEKILMADFRPARTT